MVRSDMADAFKLDDRVMAQDGLMGTVVAVDGVLITVRFDTAMLQTIVATKLTKIESDENEQPPDSFSHPV